MAALADHVQEFHLNVHTGLDVQHMAVDDGAHAVAAGDKALPFQGGQNVPQLGAANAHFLRQDTLPGQALTIGIGAVFHIGKQLGANGF